MPITALLTTLFFAASPSSSCVLRPTHGTPLLLGDVTKQTIELTSSGKCTALANGAVIANGGDTKHRALITLKKAQKKANTWTLEVPAAIPSAPTALASTWNIFASETDLQAGQKAIAQLYISSFAVKIEGRTRVRYHDPQLDNLWSNHVDTKHTAYYAEDTKDLFNTTHFTIPDLGPIDYYDLYSATAYLYQNGSSSKLNSLPKVSTIPQIHFWVAAQTSTPIMATATAHRPSGETFTLVLSLAASARASSLPLNIAEIGYVLCQKDVRLTSWDAIYHNKLAAVTNQTVVNRQCKLIISEEEIRASVAKHHKISYQRHLCEESSTASSNRVSEGVPKSRRGPPAQNGPDRCKTVGALEGELVTVLNPTDEATLGERRKLYGDQSMAVYTYTDSSQRKASKSTHTFSASQSRKVEFEIDFGDQDPSPERVYVIEASSQAFGAAGDPPGSATTDKTYRSKIRPKGPFGITHAGHSLGSKSIRIFATVPVNFTAVRFPAAGLDLKSSSDSSIAQISTLTTGLLITAEPWDYTRATNMLAVPVRFQAGLLMSNWYKGVFHPSTYLGGSITLPIWRGTDQLDTDLALGVGWEVDLRSGYESFGPRNHLLVTLGINFATLFGSKSVAK